VGAGLGVERQEQDCRALAERLGLPIGAVLVDNDLSAYNSRKPRPAYQQLIEGVKAGAVTAVIAWHPDRLHRSPRELEQFIDIIEAAGIPVHTVTAGDVDLSTAHGRMTARIVGAVARHESEHKSERNRRKHLELAEKGLPSGGQRRYGYGPRGGSAGCPGDRPPGHLRRLVEPDRP
jgi:site-specific DNA recombinase